MMPLSTIIYGMKALLRWQQVQMKQVITKVVERGFNLHTNLSWVFLNSSLVNATGPIDKTSPVQVIGWCRQTASHFLSQCQPKLMASVSQNNLTFTQLHSPRYVHFWVEGVIYWYKYFLPVSIIPICFLQAWNMFWSTSNPVRVSNNTYSDFVQQVKNMVVHNWLPRTLHFIICPNKYLQRY